MKQLAGIFKALSDETRLQMMSLLLRTGELCVCDFVAVLDITQSKASRHLRYLVNAGLLIDRRAATWVYYRVTPEPKAAAAGILSLLSSVLAGQSDPQLSKRLDRWRRKKSCGATCGAPAATRRATTGGKH